MGMGDRDQSYACANRSETTGWRARWGKAVTCLVLTGVTALSCGDTEGEAAGSIESLDELLRQLAASECRGDCGATYGSYLEYVYGEECLELYTLIYQTAGATINGSINAGRTSFDAKAAQRCVDALEAEECTEADIACEEILVGRVPIGEACRDSSECAGSAYCSSDLDCPGTCVAQGGPGDDCTLFDYDACEVGLDCVLEDGSDYGVCGRLKANGESCEYYDECQSYNCEATDDGYRCADFPEEFTKGPGEPCDYDEDCELGLYCPQGSCTPAAALGEACSVYTIPCSREGYCALESGNDGICVKRIPLGGACDDSEQCATGVCDGGECQKHSGLGGPCATDERCFGMCEDGECAAYPACFEE